MFNLQALGLAGLDKSVELLNQIVDANKKLQIVGILGIFHRFLKSSRLEK